MKKTQEELSSTKIKEFLDFCSDVANHYECAYSFVGECDKQYIDFMHDLELQDLKYDERAKEATKISKMLKERRVEKDFVQVHEEFADYVKRNEEFKKVKYSLEKMLGNMRKEENKLNNRHYNRRSESLKNTK